MGVELQLFCIILRVAALYRLEVSLCGEHAGGVDEGDIVGNGFEMNNLGGVSGVTASSFRVLNEI